MSDYSFDVGVLRGKMADELASGVIIPISGPLMNMLIGPKNRRST